MHTITEKRLLMLRPQDIRPSPNSLRQPFADEDVEALGLAVAACGIIEPLPVRKNSRGHYELICGARRLAAAKKAGLRRVPCIVHSVDDLTAALYCLLESIQYKSPNYFEISEGINRLIKVYGLTYTETALSLGISQGYLSAKLKLLKLDNRIKERLLEENQPEAVAYMLLSIPAEMREQTLNKIINDGLNVRGAKELINGILSPQKTEAIPQEQETEAEKKPLRKTALGDLRILENSLVKLYEGIKASGIDIKFLQNQTDSYVEYKFRILKKEDTKSSAQLSFKI